MICAGQTVDKSVFYPFTQLYCGSVDTGEAEGLGSLARTLNNQDPKQPMRSLTTPPGSFRL